MTRRHYNKTLCWIQIQKITGKTFQSESTKKHIQLHKAYCEVHTATEQHSHRVDNVFGSDYALFAPNTGALGQDDDAVGSGGGIEIATYQLQNAGA